MTLTDDLFDDTTVEDTYAHQLAYTIVEDRREVYDRKLEQLIFITDAVTFDTSGVPLTDLEWSTNMVGMYSEELSHLIEEYHTTSTYSTLYGDGLSRVITGIQKPSTVSKVVLKAWDTVGEKTEGMVWDEIVNLVENDPRYKKGPYHTDGTLDWNNY